MIKKHSLHGFLGAPGDWSLLDHATTWDLFSNDSLSNDSLESWARWFNAQHQIGPPKLLMGYSLGGRLALHALIQNPSAWSGAVIISTHPGLQFLPERQMRLEHDHQWAKRFITDPWDQLINDWNQQSVFDADQPLVLNEQNFDRTKLYRMMTQWSLGTQSNLRSQIADLDLPILWVSGENDVKFRKLAEGVTLSHPHSKFWIAPQVGHRVHCVQQESFINRLNEFEESLC